MSSLSVMSLLFVTSDLCGQVFKALFAEREVCLSLTILFLIWTRSELG